MSEYAEWGWAVSPVRDSAKFRALYSSPSFNLAVGQQHTEVSSQGEGQGTRRLSSAVPGPGRMEKGVIETEGWCMGCMVYALYACMVYELYGCMGLAGAAGRCACAV